MEDEQTEIIIEDELKDYEKANKEVFSSDKENTAISSDNTTEE